MADDFLSSMRAEVAPQAPASPYADLMRQEVQRDQQRRAAAATLAVDTNPDEAAKQRRTAGFLGVAPAVVSAAPADAERQARIKTLEQDTAAAPTLRQRYTDKDFAALAHDDSGVLAGIERVVRGMMQRPGTRKQVDIDPVMSGVQFSDTVRRMVEQNPALDRDTARMMIAQRTQVENGAIVGEARGPAPTIGSVARGIFNSERLKKVDAALGVAAADALGMDPARQLGDYRTAAARADRLNPEFETATGRGLYAGAVGVVDNAPGLALSIITGSPLPGLAIAGARTTADAYGKYRERGGTAGQAALGGAAEGAVEVATELLPMSFMVKKLGKAGAGEFLQGLLAREVPGEQLATLAQDAIDTAVANPNKTWGEYIAERPDAAYQTLLATLVQSGAIGSASAVASRLAPQKELAQQADDTVNAVGELAQMQQASKLAQRDPASFTQFVQEITESGDMPTELYVDGQQMANVLAQTGVDPAALAAAAPSLVAQLQDPVPGSDLRVPVAELVALGPDFTTPLMEHLREAPDAMSRAEAQTFLSEQGAKIKADVERMLTEREEATAFKQQVEDATAQFEQQLATVNRFRPEVNKAYANLLGNYYAVQALRAGVPLADMLQRYDLRIVAQTKAGALLDQDVPLGQGPVETPAFKAWFGDSHAAIGINTETGRPIESSNEPVKIVPQAMYHTTRDVFNTFQVGRETVNSGTFGDFATTRHALFVTPEIEASEAYGKSGGKFVRGANVMPVFIRAENPLDLTSGIDMDTEDALASAGLSRGWVNNQLGKWAMFDDEDGKAFVEAVKRLGYDSVIFNDENPDTGDSFEAWAVFTPEQIKSAIGNDGTYDANDPNILSQADDRVEVTRGSFDPSTNTMALLAAADLSTFIHESGHFFLEVQADLAARIQTAISQGQQASPGEQQIVDDFNAILAWFNLPADPQRTPLDVWVDMSLDEKRQHHEKWARGFEAYVMEGKAPSMELQPLFARFRAWLVQVYKTLAGLNVELSDDVRSVMNRLLASDTAIAEAQAGRDMGPMFQTPEQAGMTLDEYQSYQALAERATAAASAELDTRLMRDMKWLSKARDKALKEAQAAAKDARTEVEREVRAEVMAEPIYRAWSFLTGKAPKAQDQSAREESSREVKDWKAKRTEQEDAARKAEREKLYAANPDVKGLEKGQLAAKNKRQIDINVAQQMLEWDRANPKPALAPAATEDLGPEFAVGKLLTSEVKTPFKDAFPRLRDLGMLSEERGTPPDLVAEMFGFASGEQLVKTLAITAEPAKVIDELTDFQTLQRFGDISSPEALNRAADEAVHNELRARVIANEMKALAKANRVTESGDSLIKQRDTINVMARAAKDYAAQVIARQQIKNLRPGQYAAAEARSAKLAAQALGKSTEEAAMHKRNQLVNNYATKAAYEAQAEVRKGVEFFRKVARGDRDTVSKTRDWDMVQAARAVLAEYGMGTKGEAAQKYLEAVAQYDPATAQVLRDKVDALTVNAKPLNQLTVEEFRGLLEEVQGLWYLAKRSRQVEIDGKLVDIEEAKRPLIDRMEAIGVPLTVPGEGKAVTDGERRVARLRSAAAALRRVENWADAKDGSTPGPFRKFVWQPVKDAADAYRTDKAKFLKRYRDLLAGLDVGRARIEAPELGYSFGYSRGGSGKAEILHALLHTGNASNKRKLLLGRKWAIEQPDGTLDTTKWDGFVKRMIDTGVLTKADFDFAQGVWDLLEEMKPRAQKAHRDVFGRYFDEVTADAFDTPFGQYRGGYVPAMTDAEVVRDAATRSLQEAESQSLAYAFPSTAKGFTKARVEYNAPLLLDLRTLSAHIDKVLLFSHMEQPIREVRRVLTSKAVAMPLHRIDPAAFDGILTPWMNRAARQQVETPIAGDNGLMRFFSKMRSRAGMAAMFANVVNTAQQITGLSIAAVKVRPRYLSAAMVDYARAPRQFARAVADASPYMATRMENEVAAMSDAINDILLNPSVLESAQGWFAKHAYFLQSAVDNIISPVVWTGAYNQYLEAGHSEMDARRLADAAVRQTQGSTLAEDVSRFETGHPVVRMFTQFAGYFNMQANLLGTEFATTMRELGLRNGMGRGVYVFTFGFLAPALVSELIVQAFRGGPEDEDHDGVLDDWLAALFKGVLRSGLAMVPVAGQITNAVINTMNDKPYDDRVSTAPAISMIDSAASAPASVYKAVFADGSARKAVRDVATLIAMSVGIPATAIARPLGYLADVEQGRVEPTSPADAARGAVTGVASPDSKR